MIRLASGYLGGAVFIQVIEGRVLDRTEIREAVDRWARDLASTAGGWLGTTAGVTANEIFFMVTVFDSAAARRNSDRPEQHQWWTETSKLFARDMGFHDCPVTGVIKRGRCDDAGFVQIVQGRVPDAALTSVLRASPEESGGALGPRRIAVAPQVVQLMLSEAWPTLLPHYLGGVAGYDPGGGILTEAGYFTSEPAFREATRQPPPPDHASLWHEWQYLLAEQQDFELTEPWDYSPQA